MVARAPRRVGAGAAALLALVAIVFVLVRVPFVDLPLERDEGDYAYVAWRMLEGEVPYRDVFDQKPPGIYVVYAALLGLGARSEVALHLLLYLWTAACAVALHRLLRELAGEPAAAFAALAFALLATDPRLTATAANTESFMLLPILASWGAVWRARGDARGAIWLACGAWIAAACWLKPVAATSGLLSAAWIVVAGLSAARRPLALELGRRIGLVALGGALLSAPFLLALAAAGALGPFLDIVVVHNLAYSTDVPLALGIAQLEGTLRHLAPSHAIFWLLALAGLLAAGEAPLRVRLFFGTQLVAAFLGACVGLHFRPHYLVQLLPALCALAGLGLAAASRRLHAMLPALRPQLAQLGLAAIPIACFVAADAGFLFAGSPHERSRRIYALNPFAESERIALHLALTSGPDESVFVVGSEPQIPFLAGRRSATRYILFYPLTGPYPDALERQREAMREVARARPLFVVVVDGDGSHLLDERSERWIYGEVARLLQREYRLELLFHATPDGEDYVEASGEEAMRWLLQGKAAQPDAPWVGVYRRVR
jgi:4-amino-4-deoxy-L-arabinose transferase-like glycosyltransferase